MILPPAAFQQSQQCLVQQLPSGQMVQRPLSVGGGGGCQTMMAQPQMVSISNPNGSLSTFHSNVQRFS